MKKSKPLELTYEKDGIDYKIYIFQGSAGKYEFKTIKAVTIAERYDDRELPTWDTWHCGHSACSGRDKFDVNLGIIKAVGNADSTYARYDVDNNEAEETDNSDSDMAVATAIRTAKRIDERNIERNKRKASAEFHLWASDCAKGICGLGSCGIANYKTVTEGIETANRLAKA